jgi:predicted glycosyltransferase
MNKTIPMTNDYPSRFRRYSRDIRQDFLGDGSCDGQPAELRVVLYSHDTMGVGHMRRNLLIAHKIKTSMPNTSVLVIAGAKEAATFAHAVGIDCLTLPSFQKSSNGAYGTRHLGIPANEVLDFRGRTILTAIQNYKPDLLIADKLPCGAGGELLLALEWLTKVTTCRCVLGLREILDTTEAVIQQWQRMHAGDIIQRHFDSIWIYGDPAVYDTVSEYRFSPAIAARTTYTGYLDTRLRISNLENHDLPMEQPFVLCTVGGGQDGEALAFRFIEAMRMTRRPSVLLTGPYMPSATRKLIQANTKDLPWLKVVEFASEGDLLIKNASHVVSMGGYNTLSAILSHRKPALIVPRVSPRQEQLIRARRLAALGHVETIHPDDLTADGIVRWLDKTNSTAPETAQQLDMGGLDRICELIRADFPANVLV